MRYFVVLLLSFRKGSCRSASLFCHLVLPLRSAHAVEYDAYESALPRSCTPSQLDLLSMDHSRSILRASRTHSTTPSPQEYCLHDRRPVTEAVSVRMQLRDRMLSPQNFCPKWSRILSRANDLGANRSQQAAVDEGVDFPGMSHTDRWSSTWSPQMTIPLLVRHSRIPMQHATTLHILLISPSRLSRQ